jgi:ATP-dependent 26S proteasome regulatory subunit
LRNTMMPSATYTDEFNLAYLEFELHWVNLVVQKCVAKWELAGQDPRDPFRGLRIDPSEAGVIASQPPCGNWGDAGPLPEEQELAYANQFDALNARRAQVMDRARDQQVRLRLAALSSELGLTSFEYQSFLVCLAASLDLRYERLFGFLQNDVTHKSPGVNLILDLLLAPGPGRLAGIDCFREGAPLLRLGLIQPVGAETMQRPVLCRDFLAAPEVVSWILGKYASPEPVCAALDLLPPPYADIPRLDEQRLAGVDWPEITRQGVHLAFSGADRRRQLFAAQWIAEKLGRSLLVVDLPELRAAGGLTPDALRLILRDCALLPALPFLAGWEALGEVEPALQTALLVELAWFPGTFFSSSAASWNAAGVYPVDPRPILRWDYSPPTYTERRRLWRHYLGESYPLPEADLDLLTGQFILTCAQIQSAVQGARDLAAQQQRSLTAADLLTATRMQSSHHLDSLTVKIKPRYNWQDVVLPEEELSILKEIVATIRGRARVLDEWGLGKKLIPNPGISVLFAGPPGTGKTLSAQVIAAELGLDLYRVDLSTVVSKYIGETEKNLERIFSQAANSNTILFFDEADSIFGKRSEVKDAHDRYANIEVSYLLQRIETYDGVVILASNLRSNLDEAFIRRLQFIVDFPFPDETQRLSIWKVLFPPGVPRIEPLDFESLATRFRLSGGNIRNVIVNAAFAAASEDTGVANRHLIHAVRREMQKMGRLINEKELSL